MKARPYSWTTGISLRLFEFCQPFTNSGEDYPAWTKKRVVEGSISTMCYRKGPKLIKGYMS